MNFELRLKALFDQKKAIQELEQKHKHMVNKLSHDLQLIGFAERERKIKKIKREINNKTRKLIEAI